MTDAPEAITEAMVTYAVLEPAPVQGLAALFDDGLAIPRRGDVLPPLWHWVALPSWASATLTGPDGHPATGGFIPDVGKPRRMFAGGRVELHGPLLVGSQVRREDRILSVAPKSGRQGDFVLVKVETRLYDEGGQLAVVEVQDLVYRDAASPTAGSSANSRATAQQLVPALLTANDGGWDFRSDPTKLLRFSAVTSNAHRIHYDHPYATDVEGYPGLVVHGPLMTLALAEAVRLSRSEAPRVVTHRNVRPLFCGEDATITLTVGDIGLDVVLSRRGEPRALLSVHTNG